MYWEKFKRGARANGIPEPIILNIFKKINGNYMFPESHSYAFAISAFEAAWLKCHYPVEFFVTLMNCQPMGFYPIEALKEDARRSGVPFWNPCVNRSEAKCTVEDEGVRVGLEFVKNVGTAGARAVLGEREARGRYISVGNLVQRVRLKPESLESLVMAGALEDIAPNRTQALWEAGVYLGPSAGQRALPLHMEHDVIQLEDLSSYERMLAEYGVMGIYPKGHLMEFVRPVLGDDVRPAEEAKNASESEILTVAGWPIARQHPRGEKGTVFITIEDETGDIQLILWQKVFEEYKMVLSGHVIKATGNISRWDGTPSLVVTRIEKVNVPVAMPATHDWH